MRKEASSLIVQGVIISDNFKMSAELAAIGTDENSLVDFAPIAQSARAARSRQ
jgi:hypothetical protein